MPPEDLDSFIGMRLGVGLPGPELTDRVRESLRRTRAQSLVLFRRNFLSPAQLTQWLNALHRQLQRAFLVMVDHEGGRVIRFASGVTRYPDARTAGARGVDAVERQGMREAEELRRLGVHVNLAPCVDVVVEGSDSIIGDRSYGSETARVSQLGVARIRGLQSSGVAASAKHFPGLGAVPCDPHKVLPTVSLDWSTMERVHLPPFRAVIEAGVAMVMSSHVCYPRLGDPAGLPATFSPQLIRGLLRDRMGFQGVIATDDMEMGALGAHGGMGERAVRATEAGHDLLLICSDLDAAEEASAALRQAYQSGRLSLDDLKASAARIDQVRQRYVAP
jgi:beta-N-acetylhexosaminidase